jgi:hypothetical protein
MGQTASDHCINIQQQTSTGMYQAQFIEEQMKLGEKDNELERLRVDLAKFRGAETTTATVVVDASQPQPTTSLKPVANETQMVSMSTQRTVRGESRHWRSRCWRLQRCFCLKKPHNAE